MNDIGYPLPCILLVPAHQQRHNLFPNRNFPPRLMDVFLCGLHTDKPLFKVNIRPLHTEHLGWSNTNAEHHPQHNHPSNMVRGDFPKSGKFFGSRGNDVPVHCWRQFRESGKRLYEFILVTPSKNGSKNRETIADGDGLDVFYFHNMLYTLQIMRGKFAKRFCPQDVKRFFHCIQLPCQRLLPEFFFFKIQIIGTFQRMLLHRF